MQAVDQHLAGLAVDFPLARNTGDARFRAFGQVAGMFLADRFQQLVHPVGDPQPVFGPGVVDIVDAGLTQHLHPVVVVEFGN